MYNPGPNLVERQAVFIFNSRRVALARIAGVNIPTAKRVVIALTYIYGIGRKKAEESCQKTKISEDKRVQDLTDD